ncbi:MAG: glycosyltransferase [Acidobacteriota bacterium]|nr:glycosyltransferase [Acidobacteriota bacterium]
MIRVAALTSSLNDPSSRFRMRQFFRPLGELGIQTVEYRPWVSKYAPSTMQLTGLTLASRVLAVLASRRYDITWLNRELMTGRETFERFAGRPLLFDVDDAIWLTGGSPDFARRIAARSAGVIAGNRVIADYFRPHAPRVWIVPASVDTALWKPAPHAPCEHWTVGWSGTHWNLKYLYRIEKPLSRFLSDHRDARLRVVCDRRPEFQHLRDGQWSFVRWSPENEVSSMQVMNVGIMPLEDNPWTRAKCAMKMLCYLSVGLPAIVTPVGVADEILMAGANPIGLAAWDDDAWYQHLHSLYNNRAQASAMGIAGREAVIEHYSVERSAKQLAQIFADVVSS